MPEDTIRSRRWTTNPLPRYWWHRLPGMDYVPSIYSELAPDEWDLVSAWFEETDRSGQIGECVVPLMSFLQGLIVGNRADRIVQLGTCSGYSMLLIGFMLRRMDARNGLFTIDCDPAMCTTARRWLIRARLEPYVTVQLLTSTDPTVPDLAARFSGMASCPSASRSDVAQWRIPNHGRRAAALQRRLRARHHPQAGDGRRLRSPSAPE